MQMKKNAIARLALSAMFLAIGLVLPFLTGQIPEIGSMLLPLHLPALVCGFVCGWQWGLAVGFVLPLLRSMLFGMPRNMNGTYGEQAEKVKAFSEKLLEQWEGPYDYFDERLTTVSAERVLVTADVSRKKRKQVVDKLAAVVILQGYLDSGRNR